MFNRKVRVSYCDSDGVIHLCPQKWIDNFAMRNFTNDPIFDDTLPVGDGVIEIGARVPVERLRSSMDDWFRRKGYLKSEDKLVLAPER